MSIDREVARRRLRSGLDWIELDLQVTHQPRSSEELAARWTVMADLPDLDVDEDEFPRETIFWMDGWLFPVVELGRSLAYALDAVDRDSEVFVPLTDAEGKLDNDYEFGGGSYLVAVNRVTLAREWRGLGGLGRYLAGSGLLLLSDFATCIVLHPSPFELQEKFDGDVPQDEWLAGTEKLTAVWRTLGAEPAPGGNLVIDPTLVYLEDAVDEMYRELSGRA